MLFILSLLAGSGWVLLLPSVFINWRLAKLVDALRKDLWATKCPHEQGRCLECGHLFKRRQSA